MMRVQAEMANIDRDGSGTSDRIEFIGSLLSPDSKGSSYFDFELRKAFEKYDSNRDGYLDAGELVQFLTVQFSHELQFATLQQKDELKGILKELGANVVELLDDRETSEQRQWPVEKQVLRWDQFKNFNSKCKHKMHQTRMFIIYLIKDNEDFRRIYADEKIATETTHVSRPSSEMDLIIKD